MAGEAVGTVGQHTAIGQVRKAQPEGKGRPGVDRGQPDQQRAPDGDQQVVARRPVQPACSAVFVADRLAIAENSPDDRRIADQRRDPAAEQRIARADMRIERTHGDDIAHRPDHDVDHEHGFDDRQRDPFGPRHDVRQIGSHDMAIGERHDRQHESGEEGLDDPSPPVLPHRLAFPARPHQQQCAEMPRVVARVHHHPVDPVDIGHREDDEHRRGIGEHGDGEHVLSVPIPAAQAIEPGDDRPRRPQPRQLDQRHPAIGSATVRKRPVEPGGGTQVNLVDHDRPQRHRDRRGQQPDERGIGAAKGIVRNRPVETLGQPGKCAREGDPGEQPGQTDQPDGRRDIALRPRQGCLLRRAHDPPSLTPNG